MEKKHQTSHLRMQPPLTHLEKLKGKKNYISGCLAKTTNIPWYEVTSLLLEIMFSI
jgi:hypothetical protein